MKLADGALAEVDVRIVLAALSCAVPEIVFEATGDAESFGAGFPGRSASEPWNPWMEATA
jgi:hypothetical protein